MGIDQDADIALLKALTEFCERRLSKISSDLATKLTERSDGFAAFPILELSKSSAELRARENALAEAVERFTWATWWDNSDTAFTVSQNDRNDDIQILTKDFKLNSLRTIEVPTNSTLTLTIYLAETNLGGYITGGAAGTQSEKKETHARAFGELLRHLLALQKIKKNSYQQNLSFYEQRLWGFGSGKWNTLVENRLKIKGLRNINLPALIVDKAIVHPYLDFIVVHRCLFENQPIFLGGALERLCI
jgi:hypothetical protein